MKLDRKRNAQVPAPARQPGGWYEEDCEVAIPMVTFPSAFKPEQVQAARETIARWFPELRGLWEE
jgi:hypothetical protein